MCQVFNFINARKIHEEKNVFEGNFSYLQTESNDILIGITRNKYFIIIVFGITVMQIVIGTFGNRPFSISPKGINVIHWLIAFGIGSLALVWGLILKLVKVDKFCPKVSSFYCAEFLIYR